MQKRNSFGSGQQMPAGYMAIGIQGGSEKMTLKDISNGPEWILWAIFGLFLIISIVLISGHGENLIAGYNTADKEEKSMYDTKKLCRVVGVGFLIITFMILAMVIWFSVLPAWFAAVFLVVVVIDCIVIIILSNTICRK